MLLSHTVIINLMLLSHTVIITLAVLSKLVIYRTNKLVSRGQESYATFRASFHLCLCADKQHDVNT